MEVVRHLPTSFVARLILIRLHDDPSILVRRAAVEPMIMKRKREVRSKHGLSFEEREAAVKAREDYCAWLERVIAFRRDPYSCLAASVEASKRLLSDAALGQTTALCLGATPSSTWDYMTAAARP